MTQQSLLECNYMATALAEVDSQRQSNYEREIVKGISLEIVRDVAGMIRRQNGLYRNERSEQFYQEFKDYIVLDNVDTGQRFEIEGPGFAGGIMRIVRERKISDRGIIRYEPIEEFNFRKEGFYKTIGEKDESLTGAEELQSLEKDLLNSSPLFPKEDVGLSKVILSDEEVEPAIKASNRVRDAAQEKAEGHTKVLLREPGSKNEISLIFSTRENSLDGNELRITRTIADRVNLGPGVDIEAIKYQICNGKVTFAQKLVQMRPRVILPQPLENNAPIEMSKYETEAAELDNLAELIQKSTVVDSQKSI